ncbi:hypothetical protein BD309DRAFT_991526 [Dichomitus squalens]|nr:hypothetical protein BD309DRAFT_991526 [Dichomitus squalens]
MSTSEGIPLSYLVQHSAYLCHIHPRPLDGTFLRAIRAHAADTLEIRMLVTAPSKGAWHANAETSKHDSGGYEIRLKHRDEALARANNSARHEWEERTVYVVRVHPSRLAYPSVTRPRPQECVPPAHRTVPRIAHFLSALLPPSSPDEPTRIQAISLPPHHLDRPGAPPKPKGFAFVTLASASDAARLVAHWPWLPRRTSLPSGPGADANDEGDGGPEAHAGVQRDAVKFGFRALRKARWDAMREEYLEHRQALLDEIARVEGDRASARRMGTAGEAAGGPSTSTSTRTKPDTVRNAVSEPALDPSAAYPPGCLVFVRDVHPETNKTALKTLFAAHAFGSPAALDYVDYHKGMTSCHVRVATPAHARMLVSALADRPVVQAAGLDDAGAPPSEAGATRGAKPVKGELVDGEREALYWNKLPEKVRREAVRKAIAQAFQRVEDAATGGEGEHDAAAEERQGKRARKRRRNA